MVDRLFFLFSSLWVLLLGCGCLPGVSSFVVIPSAVTAFGTTAACAGGSGQWKQMQQKKQPVGATIVWQQPRDDDAPNSSNDSDDNEEDADSLSVLYYNDFGDQLIGGTTSSSSDEDEDIGGTGIEPSSTPELPSISFTQQEEQVSSETLLQRRIRSLKYQQEQQDERLQRNWQRGNWHLETFCLPQQQQDDWTSTNMPQEQPQRPPGISSLAVSPSNNGVVWMGRTDGTVVQVQLRDAHTQDTDPTTTTDPPSDACWEWLKSFSTTETSDSSATSDAVTHLLPYETSHLFTYTETMRKLQQWFLGADDHPTRTWSTDCVLPNTNDNNDDQVVQLQVVDLPQQQALLCATTVHGYLTLLNVTTGDILYQGQCEGCSSSSGSSSSGSTTINSAHCTADHWFLGTNSGHVWVYSLHELLLAEGSEPARAKQSWPVSDANDDAVTSLIATTSTTTSTSSSSPATTRLVTGTGRGVIQQWQVWQTNSEMIQYWPKLPTQKLPQQMHFMATTDRTQAIHWLQLLWSENDKNDKNNSFLILSATDTDISAWNAVTGKQVFGMHGWLDSEKTPFGSSTSNDDSRNGCWLHTPRRLLSTAGPWVCIHDFAHAQEFGTDDDDYDSDAAQDYLAGL